MTDLGKPPAWAFLSNHAHVLVCLDRDPDTTMREVAEQVGITLRAVQGIVAHLVEEGYLVVERHGRRNHYTLDRTRHLRHPLEQHSTVGDLLDALADPGRPRDRVHPCQG
ncbi:helix-turn-helix transcriptional regulator [Nonomuraea polychroma]|uniref:helix-turn-helix transcriptional regulator n=1 Tax=Nonomuraea polychroma TaxID=46176 RepID=UPI003D901EB7